MKKPLPIAALTFAVLVVAAPRATEADTIDFNRDIKPILSDKCYACHGPDSGQRQGGGEDGLRLDTKAGAFADLDGHFAIVPGDLKASELIKRITSDDEDEVMPPADHLKSLSASERQRLIDWVQQGANWSSHWAYAVPKSGTRPAKNDRWIDAMVRAKAPQFQPSARAEKHVLARRVFFDLIGLPPTSDQVTSFSNDQSDDAWEKLVDELLQSPHFGERMAIYWLDLVRYADTVGYHGDQDVTVSPYRDYVINAFNQNMPFDQFTREQLAGDLLPEPTDSQRIASGYNKLGMMSAEGGAQPKEYLAKYASDRVRTASTVWLGSTLGCAECHDHKFDPFTQKDFYQFASFFADIKERGLYSGASKSGAFGPTIKVPDTELPQLLEPLETKLAKLQADYDGFDVAESQQKWESEIAAKATNWKLLVPRNAKSLFGTRLKLQRDQSLLATGPNGGTDTYSFRATVAANRINGFRLEVLPDDSLPKKGPGRAGNGNFVLSEFRVSRLDKNGGGKLVTFSKATASIEQGDGDSNAYKGWKAAATIDRDVKGANWGWAILPGTGKRQAIVFHLKNPIESNEPVEFLFRLEQNHENEGHLIGRFRVSTTSEAVELDPFHDIPQDTRDLLAKTDRTEEQQLALTTFYRTIAPELADIRKQITDTSKQRDDLAAKHTRLSLVTETVAPREMRVLGRGNWMDESGEVVSPGVPHFLPQIESKPDTQPTRLDLADWITSPQNPLTARVFVNRLWKLYFGTGLSKVLDDIGSQGEYPSHPELLDELAIEFIDSGWDIKHLVKLIVTSDTYQQSSLLRDELAETDPYNRLLARQSRFRLDAELVRDNALAVSGLLVRDIGGRSVKPYQPAGLLRHLNFPKRKYKHDSGSNQYRRGVYTHWQRQFLHPAMKSFDAPAREECTAERPRSNTPLAALVLLNDPSYVEAARTFAENVLASDAKTEAERIERIFDQALNRKPNGREVAVLSKLMLTQRERYTAQPDAAKQIIATGERPVAKDIDPVELATLLSVTRAVFNLHEFITRN